MEHRSNRSTRLTFGLTVGAAAGCGGSGGAVSCGKSSSSTTEHESMTREHMTKHSVDLGEPQQQREHVTSAWYHGWCCCWWRRRWWRCVLQQSLKVGHTTAGGARALFEQSSRWAYYAHTTVDSSDICYRHVGRFVWAWMALLARNASP